MICYIFASVREFEMHQCFKSVACVCRASQDLDSDSPEPSDWDKYAAEEYEILVAEETANEQLQEGWVRSRATAFLSQPLGFCFTTEDSNSHSC